MLVAEGLYFLLNLDCLYKSGLKLLEPVMRVEVVTPEDYMGDVIGDLNSRRGQIVGWVKA